jgi:hypothetical protein
VQQFPWNGGANQRWKTRGSNNNFAQSWRSVSQPSRAGLKFGYRPYGPGSDLRFIAGSHTPSLAPEVRLSWRQPGSLSLRK